MENKLAENIRVYRKNMGFTQEQLAERLGITLGTISKWERGTSEPDLLYVMQIAELFHVSVDALIGFTMHGNNVETEIERICAMIKNDCTIEQAAKEYDNLLIKFPNNFDAVYGAAKCHMQIGVVYRQHDELKRAIELLRHTIDLLSQNNDPDINEVVLRNDIAQCYSTLEDYKKAVEEYKKNNLCGNNDAEIGLILIEKEKQLKEGIKYTETAFINSISQMISIFSAYAVYYRESKNIEKGIRAARWAIDYLKNLKDDPDQACYMDKITCLYYLVLAFGQDISGNSEEAEESLREAVRMAREFDANPISTLDNIIFADHIRSSHVYDNGGPTAMEGLRRTMNENKDITSDAFKQKFDILMKKEE
ncbi:MAG: helix-turn-helix transcriptional regulator [Clostridia bacterium]|nr:helix-turn-helix transcriptional regulator [Clostridia bacterium]